MTYAALGLAMSQYVPKYFPYEAQHWSQIPEDIQAQINAQANLVYKNQQSQIQYLQAEGACDATRAGRLAGGLREMLVKAGGDASKMGSDPKVFGAKECAEWWRVMDRPLTMADAEQVATGTGGAKLSVICPKGATIPSCAKPAPALPPPAVPVPIPPPSAVLPPVKPQPKKANMLVVGGLMAAVAGGGYLIAKKKGWVKT